GVELGYSHRKAKGEFALIYTPKYSGSFGFGNLQSFNQALGLSVSRRLSSAWSFYVGGSADDSTVEEFIFRPSALQQTLNAPGTFDQLVGGFSQGVTTGPGLLEPLRASIYGQRFLTFGSNAALTYKPSTRLTLAFKGVMFQSQTRRSGSRPAEFLIPRTRSEQGGVSLSYA